MTMAELESANAVQAKEHAACTPSDTIDLINGAAPAAVEMVRSLTDEQLDRKVLLMDGMPEITTEMMIQLALVGHASAHLATISGAR